MIRVITIISSFPITITSLSFLPFPSLSPSPPSLPWILLYLFVSSSPFLFPTTTNFKIKDLSLIVPKELEDEIGMLLHGGKQFGPQPRIYHYHRQWWTIVKDVIGHIETRFLGGKYNAQRLAFPNGGVLRVTQRVASSRETLFQSM